MVKPLPLHAARPSDWPHLQGVFTDIDDTLTEGGRLVPEAFAALAALREAGFRIVPVTGRPIGWVDCIARTWPVDAVVGENGGLWAWVGADGRMVHRFAQPSETRRANRARLDDAAADILARVPGAALASDQPFRALDLAIDWCEDVPRLSQASVDAIVASFQAIGATCKVSSIHVNGWFGDFDKRSGVRDLVRERWDEDLDPAAWAFVGDSANDEPLFSLVDASFGVANVADFLDRMSVAPRFIAPSRGGRGFAEVAELLLRSRRVS